MHPEEIRKEVADRVDSLFKHFYGMPDPIEYKSMIDSISRAMEGLSSSSDSKHSGDPVDHDHPMPGNPQMHMVSTAAEELLDEWTGAAASEFHENFASKFDITSTNYLYLLSAMKATLLAQQAMWTEARNSIDKMSNVALDAIDGISVHCPWPGDVDFMLTVAGAAGALASLVTANPATLIGGVFTAASAVGKSASEGARKMNGEAASVDAVLNTLHSGVRQLVDDVRDKEKGIADGLTGLSDQVKKEIGKFTLPRPQLAKMRGDTDKLTGSNGLGKPISE